MLQGFVLKSITTTKDLGAVTPVVTHKNHIIKKV